MGARIPHVFFIKSFIWLFNALSLYLAFSPYVHIVSFFDAPMQWTVIFTVPYVAEEQLFVSALVYMDLLDPFLLAVFGSVTYWYGSESFNPEPWIWMH
jgi:hypothetical protein